jgi:hypothetical protein
VAIREEDYAMAARLRDHPYMKIYSQVFEKRVRGQLAHAVQARTRSPPEVCIQKQHMGMYP